MALNGPGNKGFVLGHTKYMIVKLCIGEEIALRLEWNRHCIIQLDTHLDLSMRSEKNDEILSQKT